MYAGELLSTEGPALKEMLNASMSLDLSLSKAVLEFAKAAADSDFCKGFCADVLASGNPTHEAVRLLVPLVAEIFRSFAMEHRLDLPDGFSILKAAASMLAAMEFCIPPVIGTTKPLFKWLLGFDAYYDFESDAFYDVWTGFDPWKHVGFLAGRPTALPAELAEEVFRLSGATFGPLLKKLIADLPGKFIPVGEGGGNVLLAPRDMLASLEDNQPKFYALVVAARATISGVSAVAAGAEFLKAGLELRGVDINGLACIPTIEDIKSCPDEYTATGGATKVEDLWPVRLSKTMLQMIESRLSDDEDADASFDTDCIESFRTEFAELHGVGANVLSLLERSVDAATFLGVAQRPAAPHCTAQPHFHSSSPHSRAPSAVALTQRWAGGRSLAGCIQKLFRPFDLVFCNEIRSVFSLPPLTVEVPPLDFSALREKHESTDWAQVVQDAALDPKDRA